MGRIKKPVQCPNCGVEFGAGAGRKRKLRDTCSIECPYCHHGFPYTCGCQFHAQRKKMNKLTKKIAAATSVAELDKLLVQVRRLKHG